MRLLLLLAAVLCVSAARAEPVVILSTPSTTVSRSRLDAGWPVHYSPSDAGLVIIEVERDGAGSQPELMKSISGAFDGGGVFEITMKPSAFSPGKYRLKVRPNDEPRTLDLSITVVSSAVVVDPEELDVRVETIKFWTEETTQQKSELKFTELSGAGDVELRAVRSGLFTIPNVHLGAGTKATVALGLNAVDFGVTQGKLEITSPQLEKPLVVPYKVERRLHLGWLFVAALSGVVLGQLFRKKWAVKAELATVVADAVRLDDQLIRAAGQTDDRTWLGELKALQQRLAAITELSPNKARAQLDAVSTDWQIKSTAFEEKLAKLATTASSLRAVIRDGVRPGPLKAVFENGERDFHHIERSLERRDTEATTARLELLTYELDEKLREFGGDWAKSARAENQELSAANVLFADKNRFTEPVSNGLRSVVTLLETSELPSDVEGRVELLRKLVAEIRKVESTAAKTAQDFVDAQLAAAYDQLANVKSDPKLLEKPRAALEAIRRNENPVLERLAEIARVVAAVKDGTILSVSDLAATAGSALEISLKKQEIPKTETTEPRPSLSAFLVSAKSTQQLVFFVPMILTATSALVLFGANFGLDPWKDVVTAFLWGVGVEVGTEQLTKPRG